MGDALRHLGEREAADHELRRSGELIRELLQREPSNSQWNSTLAAIDLSMAELNPASMAQLKQQLARMDARDAAEQSGNSGASLLRLQNRSRLTQLMLVHTTPAQALEMLTPLQARLSGVLQQRPEDIALRSALARTELSMAHAMNETGQGVQARMQCQAAHDMLAEMPQLLHVHDEVTRAWDEAKACLNPA
jgi:hypothetical protein